MFSLFVPYETLGPVSVLVEESSGIGRAAVSTFDPNVVVMYRDYHLLHPEDYKVTLLHEAGHFVFSRDHSNFDIYFEHLKMNQKFISEKVLPNVYEDFLYCRECDAGDYKFVCSSCRASVRRNSTLGVGCSTCNTNMLLVSGI